MSQMMAQMAQTTKRTVRRVRHETRLRLLQVREVSRITPKMVRIVVGGDELAGFVSAAHDDHVKLFFPQPGEEKPVLPAPGPERPGVRRRRAEAAGARLHAAPLRCRGEHFDDRLRAARRRPGDELGGASAARTFPRRRRPARIVHRARRFRLVCLRRRRDARCRRSGAGWRNCRAGTRARRRHRSRRRRRGAAF